MAKPLVASLLLLTLVTGCAHDRERRAPVGLGRVSHVVVCWLKQPGNADARWKLIHASESFRALPGVEEIVVGRPIASTRPVVDSTFDLSIVFVFKDAAALRAYESSEQHQEAVRRVLKPLVSRLVIYDGQERSVKVDPDGQ
jgi:hypothetical protein